MNYNLKIIHKEEYQTSSWLGGTTTQMLIFPEHSSYSVRDFAFRISSATVDLDKSEFTELKGINRYITPLDNILRLTHNNKDFIDLQPFEVYNFSGAIPTTSYGKAKDFNLMLSEKASGNLKSVKIDKVYTMTLFKETFEAGFENRFEILISPFHDLNIKLEDRDITLSKMDLLLVNANKPNASLDIEINCEEVAEILLCSISTMW